LCYYYMEYDHCDEFIAILPRKAPSAECVIGICCTDFVMPVEQATFDWEVAYTKFSSH